MKNKAQLDAIKTINQKINNLKTIHSELEEFEKIFKKIFSKHKFNNTEKHMLSTEINSLENEIKNIASSIKKMDRLNIEHLSKLVISSWGRTKIQINEYNTKKHLEDFESAQSTFKDELYLTFDLTELQIIEYSLTTNNRDDLYLIRVFLAPGFAFAYLDNEKVCLTTNVISNEEFLIKLAKEIENNA